MRTLRQPVVLLLILVLLDNPTTVQGWLPTTRTTNHIAKKAGAGVCSYTTTSSTTTIHLINPLTTTTTTTNSQDESYRLHDDRHHLRRTLASASSSCLFLAKKIKIPSAALEAIEKLDALEQQGAEKTLSRKEQLEMLRKQQLQQQQQETPAAAAASGTGAVKKKESAAQLPEQQHQETSSSSSTKVGGSSGGTSTTTIEKKMSKKEEMLLKALEMEMLDERQQQQKEKEKRDDDHNGMSTTSTSSSTSKSKKDKADKKQQSKKQQLQDDDGDEKKNKSETIVGSKAAAAAPTTTTTTPEKKQSNNNSKKQNEPVVEEKETKEMEVVVAVNGARDKEQSSEYDDDEDSNMTEDINGVTLEDKIRKERPPPRIRVMESAQPGYISLRLEGVGVIFRNQQVLKDVTWGVSTGDRIGLVGPNGAGKTTMVRILANELEPTTGDVVKSSPDLRTGVLRQEFVDELVPERTLQEEFMSVFVEENGIIQELRQCEQQLEKTLSDDTQVMQQILDRMQDLQNQADNKGIYALESRVKKIMDLMGFNEDEADDLVASFSGGWKMRIGLGKVLLMDINVLLLDEPTNHLDLDSVLWLESFLREQSNIPMVIVSHDREFLDKVCNKIVDAEGGICTAYDGNYSRFLELKKARLDAWHAAYNAQEKKIKEERQWINEFRTKQPQAVKQREAKLEKLTKSEDYIQKPPFVGKPFKFRFPDAPRLSPEVAEIIQMSHGYSNQLSQNRLFDNVDLFIEKGDRIAIVGPNGSGKSTLLRLLINKEVPQQGSAGLVGQNVVMNFFEQSQADYLDLDKTVLETIQAYSNGQSYNELRAYLGQFLFKGDAVEKRVRNLSGGEKARLSLCTMMLRPANLLILDEPTNHLDISAKEMIEEALQHYTGSVVIVSHDRYFVSKVATSIVAIEDRKLVKYQGDYKFYMDMKADMKEKIEARYVKGVKRIESAPVLALAEIDLSEKRKNFGGAATANLVQRKNKGIKNAQRLEPK